MGTLFNLSILKGNFMEYDKKPLHRLFEETAKEKPNNTAIFFEDNGQMKKYTYQQLDEQATRISQSILRNVSNGPADADRIVAVYMEPSDELIVTLLAIWKSGAAYLPIDKNFPASRIDHILNDAKPLLVVYTGEKHPSFNSWNTISYNELSISDSCDQLTSPHQKLAIVLYTSGSTGTPKGVRLCHETILNRLKWQWNDFPYAESETTCVFKTALTFVDSVCEIWGPLLTGLTIVVVPKFVTMNPEKLVTLLTEHHIQRLVLVPTLLKSILLYLKLQRDGSLLRHLKYWISSGESLSMLLAEEFFEYFDGRDKILLNFYGSTEIMGDVTVYAIRNGSQLKNLDKIPIGRAISNTIIYLLDGEHKPVPAGQVGEIYVSGNNLASGYINGVNADKFVENPFNIDPNFQKMFKTGDYGKIVRGELYFEGRTDSQIKIRGHRIDISEVERQLLSHPQVDKGVVLCYKPGDYDQALLAFVTVKKPFLTSYQIEYDLQASLVSYMIPRITIVDSMPQLVNGKVDRQSLMKIYENTINNNDKIDKMDITSFSVPNGKEKAAEVLLETLISIIGPNIRQHIDKESNFFSIGGNSLNAVYTVTKLRDFGYFITISDFLKCRNLGEIVNNLVHENDINNEQDIKTEDSRYFFKMLDEDDKDEVIEIIASSFYKKADLEQWLVPEIEKQEYIDLLEKIWQPLKDSDLSFSVVNKQNEIVAVSLNFDAYDEPQVEIDSRLVIVLEFLEFLESQVRDNKLPKGKGKLLHSFMMGTKSNLSAQENVSVMQFMEKIVINIARERGFLGAFTTNTSPLTQQLGVDIFGYDVLLDYQVNQYTIDDGFKPFGPATNDQRAMVCWKPVEPF